MIESVEQQGEISVGLRLQKARMDKKLSQAQVAEKLFLNKQVIEYLDEGIFERIPKKAFIRGYIRAYARVVGLDGGELVAAYDSEVGGEAARDEEGTILMNAGDPSLTKNPIFRAGALGIALLMVVVGAVWIVVPGEQVGDSSGRQTSFGEDPGGNVVVQPIAEASPATGPGSPGVDQYAQPFSESIPGDGAEQGFNEAILNEQSGPAGEGREPVSLGSAVDDSSELDALPAVETENDISRTSSSQVEAEPPVRSALGASVSDSKPNVFRSVTDSGRFIQVIVDGQDTVVIQTAESCWVEVADASGYLLYGDLNKSGDDLEVIGAAPFQILLGKASAAQVHFNGQLIDLEPHTTREFTARLTLGESADAS